MAICTMESLQQQEQPNQDELSGFQSSSTNSATSSAVEEMLLLNRVSAEIDRMRTAPTPNGTSSSISERCFHSFPPACLEMLKNIKGNHRCVDCGEQNPQWAACRYGALLCLNCSGHHRSFGVQISSVRSISMDEWSVTEVISMLEGGNSQLTAFFERHALTENACCLPAVATQNHANSSNHISNGSNNNNNTASTTTTTTASTTSSSVVVSMINRDNVARLRYKTKASSFYRVQMEKHVQTILATGPYRGREISRQNYKQ